MNERENKLAFAIDSKISCC